MGRRGRGAPGRRARGGDGGGAPENSVGAPFLMGGGGQCESNKGCTGSPFFPNNWFDLAGDEGGGSLLRLKYMELQSSRLRL